MTELCSLQLDVRHRDVARDLVNSHEMHRTVLRLVSEAPDQAQLRETSQTLYRLTQLDREVELLVQSAATINPDRLPVGYALKTRRLDLSTVLERLSVGTTVRFSAVVAPVRSVPVPGARGKKIPLGSVAQVAQWWTEHCGSWGLETLVRDLEPALRVDRDTTTANGRKKIDAQTHRLKHRGFRVSGLARVMDLNALEHALSTGIGPGKAYGMGLLTVAPT